MSDTVIIGDREYHIVHTLSQNSCYSVYIARIGNEHVVLKVMSDELRQNKNSVEIFKSSALAMMTTAEDPASQGLVKVLLLQETDTDLYIVMEYIQGVTFDKLIPNIDITANATDLDELADFIYDRLDYLRSKRLIATPPDPSNIIITDNGDPIMFNFASSIVQENLSGEATEYEDVEIVREFMNNIKENISQCKKEQLAEEEPTTEQEEPKQEKNKRRYPFRFLWIFVFVVIIILILLCSNAYLYLKASFKYDHLTTKEGVHFVDLKGKKGLLDSCYNTVFNADFDDIVFLNDTLVMLTRDQKKALALLTGKVLTSFLYDQIFLNEEGILWVEKDLKSLQINPQTGRYIYRDSDYIPFQEVDLYGYRNIFGDILIKPVYSVANKFKNGYAVVGQGDKLGLIDSNGNIQVPIKYQNIIISKFNTISAKQNNKWGIVSFYGVEVTSFIYDSINWLTDMRAKVYIDGSSQIINNNGKYEYRDEDLLIYRDLNKGSYSQIGFCDKFGNIVVSAKYYKAHRFQEGRAVVVNYGFIMDDYGYIDYAGCEVIPLKFSEAEDFYNGRAEVCESELFSSTTYDIDINGNKID